MSEEREKISIDSPINKPVAEAPQLEPIPGLYRVMRRNGKVTAYDSHKIVVAMTKAFLSIEGSSAAASSRIHNEVETSNSSKSEVTSFKLVETSHSPIA